MAVPVGEDKISHHRRCAQPRNGQPAPVTGCLLNSAARWEPAKSHANGTEPWSAQQRSERRRRGIDLIVMGTGRKGAQLFDEGLVPGTFQKFDKTMFALRGKRIGTELL